MIFKKVKDGGKDSKVTAYFLLEWKMLFSVAILVFEDGGREVFHGHAFNCISWLLKGKLLEEIIDGDTIWHSPSIFPFMTYRSTFHRVFSEGKSYVLTFRGPWSQYWNECSGAEGGITTLSWGRVPV